MRRRELRTDLIAAVAIAAISSCCWALAFAALHERDQQRDISLEALKAGTKDIFFYGGPDCIGRLHSELTPVEEDHSTIVKANGDLKAFAGSQDMSLNFSLHAEFNSLGQLGASVLKVSAAGHEISLGTVGANPITIKMKSGSGERILARSIPGPLELRRRKDETYVLVYPPLEQQRERAESWPMLSGLLTQLQLRAEPAEGKSCQLAASRGLDIRPLMALLNLLQPMQPIVPPA